jgi:hypothetical protein
MRYTDAIKVKASLLDDGVVDTLGLVGAMSGVHTSDDGESTSAVRVVATSVCGADQPPLGGQHELGPRQRPLQPLRAAHNLKPPALPGDTYFAALSSCKHSGEGSDVIDRRPAHEGVE